MTDRRKRVVIEDDDDDEYGSNVGSSSRRPNNKRPAIAGSSGPQKRGARVDDDDDLDTPAARRLAAAEIPAEDLERLVKDVVRLAIFTAHSDHALKRDDIREVLSEHSRQFDSVFQKAQERLRDVFGMELVELTSKGRTGQTAEKGTKSYVLRNTLPQALVSGGLIDYGEEELEDMGLLMVVLSLIMVRQGAIYESSLIPHLRRLSLMDENSQFGDIHKKMDVYIKRRYLEKIKLPGLLDDSGEKVEMEYRWGPRARIEFPEENVVQFIQEVFGEEAPPNLRISIVKAAGLKDRSGQ